MSLMTGTPGNIEFGPCQVTYNAVDLGYFKGGVNFVYTVEWFDIEVDQSSMLIDSKVKSERAMATVPMIETSLAVIKNVMATGTYTLDGSGVKKKIEVGGLQVASSSFYQLIITPLSDGSGTLSTDSNEKITIYKCVPKIQFSKAYNRDGERVIPVEFHAIKDSTKTAGKQLFLLGDSTATA
jgi:hypothetical protein